MREVLPYRAEKNFEAKSWTIKYNSGTTAKITLDLLSLVAHRDRALRCCDTAAGQEPQDNSRFTKNQYKKHKMNNIKLDQSLEKGESKPLG